MSILWIAHSRPVPNLGAGAVHSLLRGGVRVHRRHQALDDPELVVDHLGQGSQTVGRAGCVAEIGKDGSMVLRANVKFLEADHSAVRISRSRQIHFEEFCCVRVGSRWSPSSQLPLPAAPL